MKNSLLGLLCVVFCLNNTYAQTGETMYAGNGEVQGIPYSMLIDIFKEFDEKSDKVLMEEAGETDTDYPLHVVYYSGDGRFDAKKWHEQNKVVILINNGIHPGEPDGMNASVLLLDDILTGKVTVPDNIVLAFIPVFNVGGLINSRDHSRANQNGPTHTGFRGNAQNLDLNRDFIKMDARETRSLAKLMHKLDPDILIDNHVSNGADYQYVMTLLSTQHNKLGGPMGKYLNEKFEPNIYTEMKKHSFELVPYVNVWGTTPDKGWTAYSETPRYLSGFAAMFNTYAFVAETHMLKPFEDRIKSTYELMRSIMDVASTKAAEIKDSRKQQKQWIKNSAELSIAWDVDTTKSTIIEFKGYDGQMITSEVSGMPRLFYNKQKPYTKKVPLRNTYMTTQSVEVPKAYVVLQGWHDVIDRLKLNGVEMRKLEHDSTITASIYYITDYKTVDAPYECHYLHSNIKVRKESKSITVRKGDYIVPANQAAKRYIVETLEPTAPDGFFAWGFYDAILQQKEYFSAYVFEDMAAEMLTDNPELQKEFEQKKKDDPEFAKSSRAQLHFMYLHSPYYEPEHMRFPVYRLE
ncbi:MAG: hypothetical protein H6551_06380 [Chitinophagales bacterium]|nr:hypothetical protein [Chitinophagales bacterium]